MIPRLSLSKLILRYSFRTFVALLVGLCILYAGIFFLALSSGAIILLGYTFLRFLHRFSSLSYLVSAITGTPTSTLHPNPHYVSKMGLIDTTHWRTYLLISTLGSSIEFLFGCFFVALPFVALELRQRLLDVLLPLLAELL